MLKNGMGQQSQNEQDQMEMMMKMMYEQARATDKLFEQTGVEEDELNHSIAKLNL